MPNFSEIALQHGCSALNLLHTIRTPLDGCFCITIFFERKEPFWWVKFWVNFRLFDTIIQLVVLKKYLCDLRFLEKSIYHHVFLRYQFTIDLKNSLQYLMNMNLIRRISFETYFTTKSFSLGQKTIMYVWCYPIDPDKKYRP